MNPTNETPIGAGTTHDLNPETERIVLDRLATFDEDAKTSVDAREALQGIRQKLSTL
jgi:hypothetical protein